MSNLRITTQVQSNGTILAKGKNRQRTVSIDPRQDERDNHREAMFAVATAHGVPFLPRVEKVDISIGRAVFILG
jgi:hypothetical protein